MKKLLSVLCLIGLFAIDSKSQATYDCSFVEFGLGVRTFSDIPNDVIIQLDSTYFQNLDFGKGKPLAASLGFVIIPDEPGIAGKFSVDGYLGNTSGFGFDIGVGYKFGNERFSFTPMIDIAINRMFTHIETYNIDSTAVFASIYDPNSDEVYVGGGVHLHGGSGSSIVYNLNYAVFDLKVGSYLSYKASSKTTIFARVAYNVGIGKSEAKFEATGKGYESFQDFMDAAIAEEDGNSGEPPVIISTEVQGSGFMKQDGKNLEKVPTNFSGLQFQIGIGLNINDGSVE